jgi:hypothetical protein
MVADVVQKADWAVGLSASNAARQVEGENAKKWWFGGVGKCLFSTPFRYRYFRFESPTDPLRESCLSDITKVLNKQSDINFCLLSRRVALLASSKTNELLPLVP